MKTDFLWMFCSTQGIWSETAGPAAQRTTALTFRDFVVYGHSGRLFRFVVTLMNSLLRILTAQTGHLDGHLLSDSYVRSWQCALTSHHTTNHVSVHTEGKTAVTRSQPIRRLFHWSRPIIFHVGGAIKHQGSKIETKQSTRFCFSSFLFSQLMSLLLFA